VVNSWDRVSKISKGRKGWSMTLEVEHLYSKHVVLSSDPRIAAPSQKSCKETLLYFSITHYYSTACGRGHSTHWDSLPHL
jgi:hypothetical protein